MKRRCFLFLLGASVLLGAFGYKFWRSEREPVYGGKTLSEWAQAYNAETSLMNRPRQAEDSSPASRALQAIGTNAVPYLLRWIQYQPGAATIQYRRLANKLPPGLSLSRPGRWMYGRRNYDRSFVAAYAFAGLGTNARTAIPELTRLMNDSTQGAVRTKAIIALARTGPEALPPMLEALRGTNNLLRGRILWQLPQLQQRGVDVSSAIPTVLECLQSQDNGVVVQASGALWQLLPPSDFVLPTLISALSNQSYYVRMSSAQLLSLYGQSASNALPSLVRSLNDSNPLVRSQSTNAIEMIDDDLAAKLFGTTDDPSTDK